MKLAAKISPDDEDEDVVKKSGRKKKVKAKTYELDYVDEANYYTKRLDTDDRLQYWSYLKERDKENRRNSRNIELLPHEIIVKNDNIEFSRSLLITFNIVMSRIWDYLYLIFFFLFLVIIGLVHDGNTDANRIPSVVYDNIQRPVLITALLALMTVTQIPPICGTVYFMRCHNLRTQYRAQEDFSQWAFVAVLLSQYIENFYYGGIGKPSVEPKNGNGKKNENEKKNEKSNENSAFEINVAAKMNDRRVSNVNTSNGIVDDNGQSLDQIIQARVSSTYVDLPTDLPLNMLTEQQGDGNNEENLSDDGYNHLDEIRKKKAAEISKVLDIIAAKRAAEDSLIKDWMEWKCIICDNNNRLPTHPLEYPNYNRNNTDNTDTDKGEEKLKGEVYFESLGSNQFKRTVAVIKTGRDIPQCVKCCTYADYVPPSASAHLFTHFPGRYNVFQNYPRQGPNFPEIKLKLSSPSSYFARLKYILESVLWGSHNPSSNKLAYNDWRLPLYLDSGFTDIARPDKDPDEFYKFGEIIECIQQKPAWSRARVIMVRRNHTYDIRYDLGDELRLVDEHKLRLPPAKGNYAFRVELGMVIVVFISPIFLIISMRSALGSPQEGLTFLGIFIVGVLLLILRIGLFISYVRRFSFGGIIAIAKLSCMYIVPIIILLVACSPVTYSAQGWKAVAAVWIVMKIMSIPLLYAIKPSFALFASILFFQTSLGFLLIGLYLDSGIPVTGNSLLGTLAPLMSATITLIIYRSFWDKVWDVSLTIRYSRINEQNEGVNYSLFLKKANKYMFRTKEKIKEKMTLAVVSIDREDVDDVYNEDIENNVNNKVDLKELNT
mmetsp:Transcript_27501/g.26315  ORF Transcript_27501/g.26315 Transcript_27501/m.26315 type:complete len:831 (+) Transcript_27501:56-2548(+)